MAFRKLQFKDYLTPFIYFTTTATFNLLAIISFAIYVIVWLLSCFPNLFKNHFGKFLNHLDNVLDEDFVNVFPKNSLVVTFTLQGNMSISELRTLVDKNLVQARSKVNPCKLRFPELQQYITTFICFRIWKSDPNFLIKNHVIEQLVSSSKDLDLGEIHEELINKPFTKQRSPWDLTLIQDYNNKSERSTLALRIHHSMADGISLINLVVEGLGTKIVTLSGQTKQEAYYDLAKFYLLFPINYLIALARVVPVLTRNFFHPWLVRRSWQEKNIKQVVAFSETIPMSELKQVAKINGVATSAVVMSIIAGAIGKGAGVGPKWNQEVGIGYTLPMPNHPEGLANHTYVAIIPLPTNESCCLKRLQMCNQRIQSVRVNKQHEYFSLAGLVNGIQVFPLPHLARNQLIPTGITNFAVDQDGFSIGESKCTEIQVSAGTLCGAAGVFFVACGYKNEMRVAVIAKGSVMEKEDTNKLAADIGIELKKLQ